MLDADVEVDRREFTVRAALRVAPGERLALFGPSGAGKTTLLEVIAGLVPPRRGLISLGDRVLTSTVSPVIAPAAFSRACRRPADSGNCSADCTRSPPSSSPSA